jgi:PhoH-like ATPase
MARKKKIFILDTSVILFDHNSLVNFEDNDVAIPIQVLEELDNFKKGNDTINFEARSFIRLLNELGKDVLLNEWVKLPGIKKGKFKVVLSSDNELAKTGSNFDERKNDNKSISAALALKEEFPDTRIVLVSKDICLRVKAKSLNLLSEDYETGKVKDLDKLYSGMSELSCQSETIDQLFRESVLDLVSVTKDNYPYNHYLVMKNGRKSALAYYNQTEGHVERIEKKTVYKITPKNAEQAFALHALLNPEIKLVTLRGVAGTG